MGTMPGDRPEDIEARENRGRVPAEFLRKAQMLYSIWRRVRAMKSWKKAAASAIGAAIAAFGSELGISEEVVKWIVQLVTAYIVGQGIADLGKSKAMIENGDKK